MKRHILTLVALLTFALGAKAMSYEKARQEALYLTDKMAYELNLNDQQYEYAYEINLDYLMGLTTADDIYGTFLTYRNADLRHILHDWQWSLFVAADYFYHPVYWRSGAWYFPIYGYYNVGYYYRSCPSFYYSYRGAHCRDHYRDGWYASRRPSWNGGWRGADRGYVGHGHASGRGYAGRGGYTSGHNGGHRDGHYEGARPASAGGRGYSIGDRGGNRQGNAGYQGGGRNDNNRGSYQGGGRDDNNRGSYQGSSYDSHRGSVNSSTRTTVGGGNYGGMSSERGSRSSSNYGGSSYSGGNTTRSAGGYSGGSYSGSSHGGGYSGGNHGGGYSGAGRGGSSMGAGRGGRGHGR